MEVEELKCEKGRLLGKRVQGLWRLLNATFGERGQEAGSSLRAADAGKGTRHPGSYRGRRAEFSQCSRGTSGEAWASGLRSHPSTAEEAPGEVAALC